MEPSRVTPSPSPSTTRIFSRHPRLTIAGLVLVGTGLGFRHMSSSLREREQAQKKSAQNFYVSVDRSGGGV